MLIQTINFDPKGTFSFSFFFQKKKKLIQFFLKFFLKNDYLLMNFGKFLNFLVNLKLEKEKLGVW